MRRGEGAAATAADAHSICDATCAKCAQGIAPPVAHAWRGNMDPRRKGGGARGAIRGRVTRGSLSPRGAWRETLQIYKAWRMAREKSTTTLSLSNTL